MKSIDFISTFRKRFHSTAFWLLAGVLSLLAALTVAPLSTDPERTLYSRADGNLDALHFAVVVDDGVDKLLGDPFNYYTTPYLYPDHDQLRLITTFLSEALLAAPLRIIVGDKLLLIAGLTRIITVLLTALATMLMLRELGSGRWAAITGGLLAVLVSNYGTQIDRIQSLSLQWLALAIFFTARICKGRQRLWNSIGLAVSLFLLVHSSIYTAVVLVSVSPFFLPALVAGGRGTSGYWRKVAALTLVAAIAAVFVIAAMGPWLTDRWDNGAYLEKGFMEIRHYNTSHIGPLAMSPPEFADAAIPLMPAVRYDGYYPGHALVLAAIGVFLLGIFYRSGRYKSDRQPASARAAGKKVSALHRFASYTTVVAGSLTAVILGSWALGFRPLQIGGVAVDVLVWGMLAGWVLKLASWPQPWGGGNNTRRFLCSTAFLAATVLFLLAQGSPIRSFNTTPEIAHGIFGPLSLLIPPLAELRFLYRITTIASWFLIAGLALRMDIHAKAGRGLLVPAFSVLLIVFAFAGWIGAGFGETNRPALPEGYRLLEGSSEAGGLLELPLSRWTSGLAVYRMVWQRDHDRPIVDGSLSLEPPWFHHAEVVFNSFPSDESLWLMRKWKVGSVLAQTDFLEGMGRIPANEEGVILRGKRGGMVLFDIGAAGESHDFEDEQMSDVKGWSVPKITSPGPAARLSDGITFHTEAVELKSEETLEFGIDPGSVLEAVKIDYGFALGAGIPSSLKVLADVDGQWRNITEGRAGMFLRARAADLLLHRKPASLVIEVKLVRATRFRLRGYRFLWHVPELRVLLGKGRKH